MFQVTIMVRGSYSKKRRVFEYPFSRTWVWASVVLAGLAMAFTTFLLKDEGPVGLFTFTVHPLLLYFVFTFIFAMAILALKFYIYSTKDEEKLESHIFEDEEKRSKKLRWRRWSFILVLCLTVAALFLPLFLSLFLEPLWSFIVISGFVPAVAIPEIILYIYSRRSRRKDNYFEA